MNFACGDFWRQEKDCIIICQDKCLREAYMNGISFIHLKWVNGQLQSEHKLQFRHDYINKLDGFSGRN